MEDKIFVRVSDNETVNVNYIASVKINKDGTTLIMGNGDVHTIKSLYYQNCIEYAMHNRYI